MIVTKKIDAAKSAPYFIGQFVGGIVGAGIIALILSGTDGYLEAAQDAGFASNGYGDHSPAGFALMSVAIVEIVVTALFVLIVLGTTDEDGVPKGFGPIAAGFGLALVHMVSIPVSNTSVNPARSLATAVFQGDWALGQVWAFIVFPVVGAAVAGALWMVVDPNPATWRPPRSEDPPSVDGHRRQCQRVSRPATRPGRFAPHVWYVTLRECSFHDRFSR